MTSISNDLSSVNDRFLRVMIDPTTSKLSPGDRRALSNVFSELQELRGQRDALLKACEEYRHRHDCLLWEQNRPCKCPACDQARLAIALVKGEK